MLALLDFKRKWLCGEVELCGRALSVRGFMQGSALNSTAVCSRAMLRRSPCHRSRVHFDFSEEVVKRLHTSTLRLELTSSSSDSVTSQTLSGSHAFTHSRFLPLFFCLCMQLLQLHIQSATLNMGHYLSVYVMNLCPFLQDPCHVIFIYRISFCTFSYSTPFFWAYF